MLIEIFSDLICPWCYIGTHRLLRALSERPHVRPERYWHPFLLNPNIPSAGIDRGVYLNIRYGGRERARQMLAVIEETAKRDGLPLNMNRITRTPNTLDAHRLIGLAQPLGMGERVIDALFTAYFVHGLDIGDRDLLIALGAAAGLNATLVRSTLARDSTADLALFRASVLTYQLDLHAIPCFIFNRRFVLAGAQDSVAFLPLLDMGLMETSVSMD